MWAKVADELLDHPKLLGAAAHLGRTNNVALALGFYMFGLLYSAKHLTDGFLSREVVLGFRVAQPLAFADAMVKAGLWENAQGGGYRIHDYHDHNPSGQAVRDKRARDRARKRAEVDSDRNDGGVVSDSARNRDGVSSARAGARSRDPVPVPVPVPEEPVCR